jgi:hypothetical protein
VSHARAGLMRAKRSRALLARAIVVCGLLACCGAAVAATRRVAGHGGRQPWASQIIRPASDAVVLGRSVDAVVRVGPGVRSFQASLGGRTTTQAFRAAATGSTRVATLRDGSTPGLRFGRNTLYVRTSNGKGRRWFTQRSFVMARPVGGLFNAATAQAGCGTGAEVRVDLARPGLAVNVRVDGGPPRAIRGGGKRSINLYANSGLHPGGNVLTVQALDAGRGVYQRRVLRVTMPSAIPVAAAGISRRAKTGHAIQFSAAASVKTGPGQRLVYRWTIVTHPRASRARLQGASSAHPLLRPDRPGRYVVRVTIFEVSAASASGHVTRSELLCAAGTESVATTTVSAALSAGPIGVPLDTIATTNGSLGVRVADSGTIGSQFYPVPDHSKALQLVVLDRSTLAEEQNVSYPNNPAGASDLLSAVKRLSKSDLVIITKPDPQVTNAADPDDGDPTAAATINQALNAIGSSSVSTLVSTEVGCHPDQEEEVEDAPCSSFSAIGVPEIPVGQGALNPGLGAPDSATAPGDLHGYLREDLAGNNFTFVNVERVPLDTGAPDANPAVVTIGSDEPGSEVPKTTYTSDKLSGAGFFVLILNAGDLKTEFKSTFQDTAQGLHGMGSLLGLFGRANPTALVIVRSIGAVSRLPAGSDPQGTWDFAATQLQQLGGSQYYFDALNGKASSQFAQVGPAGWPGYPSPWTQVATHEHSGTGRLSGLLARNNSSQFYLDDAYPSHLNDPGRPLAGSLAGIMSLPTTPWPDRGTPGDQAVLGCIAAHIDPNGALRTPIENNYTNQNLVNNWAAWASTISASGYYDTLSGYKDCGSFTRPDFDEVTGQLRSEWIAVPRVWGLIANLQKPLLDTQGNAAEIGSIAAEVNEDVGTSSQPVQYDAASIVSNLLLIVAAVPGVDEVAAPLEFLSAGIDLASSLNENPDGSNAQDDVRTTAADLGASLARKYTADIVGLDETGDILISDWTKLRLAAQNAANLTNAAADWSWTSADAKKATDQLLVATRELAYTTLFPVRYHLYRLQAGAAAGSVNPQDVTPYSCAYFDGYADPNTGDWIYTGAKTWRPFGSAAQFGSVGVTVSGNGSVEQWAYATADDRFVQDKDHAAQLPSAKLLGLMFKTPTDDAYQTAPLFDPLSFALDAYGNTTTNTETVTHVNDSVQKFGGGSLSTNLKCKAS